MTILPNIATWKTEFLEIGGQSLHRLFNAVVVYFDFTSKKIARNQFFSFLFFLLVKMKGLVLGTYHANSAQNQIDLTSVIGNYTVAETLAFCENILSILVQHYTPGDYL